MCNTATYTNNFNGAIYIVNQYGATRQGAEFSYTDDCMKLDMLINTTCLMFMGRRFMLGTDVSRICNSKTEQ